jgi:hypothetical protein
MKQLIGKDTGTYAFNASARTITFSGIAISQEQILTVTNTTDGIMIYCFADSNLGGSLVGSVLTLSYNTSSMSNSDNLQIYVDVPNVVQAASLDSTTVNSLATAESIVLLRRIARLLESQSVVDGQQRQRIVVDSGAITTVTTVGTTTTLNQLSGVDAKWFLTDTARNAYANGIRSKLSWS